VPVGVVVHGATASAGAHTAGPPACGGTVAAPQALAAGTYSSLDVTGVCDISAGQVTVTGSVTIEPNAALVSAYGLANNVPGTTSGLIIGGDLTAANNSSLVLGCKPVNFNCLDEPDAGSPTLASFTTIIGSLTATNPLGVVLHHTSIHGDFRSSGGGGGKTCGNSPGANVFYAIPGNGGAVYSDIEDTVVQGNLWLTGLTSCWFGALRDTVWGSATFSDLTFMDFDSIEIVNSKVHGNMLCTNDHPQLQYGDTGQAQPDLVGGYATGDCAFSRLVQYSPGPPAQYLPIAQHDPNYNGYWMAASDGGIFSFNSLFYGSAAGQSQSISGFSAAPGGKGYQVATTSGTAFRFGTYASCTGSIPAPNRPIVGMAAVPGGGGCWLVASDGGIFSYGSTAAFYGSAGAARLTRPMVGMASAPNGDGYYLVASDGGIFTYGPGTSFLGSMGGRPLNQPIVGMAVDPTTGGYWMVASDGGIFSFDAPYFGSMGGSHLNKPIVGMAAAPGGDGYFLVASDGGIFSFGPGAVFQGSTGAIPLARPIIGMALGGSLG